MRTLLLVVVGLWSFTPALVAAEESNPLVGPELMVIRWNTDVMAGTELVDRVHVGDRLRATKANGPWLWIAERNGWVKRDAVLPTDKALAHFDDAVRQQPTAEAYRDRGIARAAVGKLEEGVKDLDQAIELGLKQPGVYLSRGRMHADLGHTDEALKDYSTAIERDAKFAPAYQLRGTTYQANGDYEEALADFAKAVSLEPQFALAWNNLAWLQATCPDARFRHGEEAVQAATKACELTKHREPRFLDTLAAALAEAGRFDDAIRRAEEALKTLSADEKPATEKRLALYRDHKPYHEPPRE